MQVFIEAMVEDKVLVVEAFRFRSIIGEVVCFREGVKRLSGKRVKENIQPARYP